MDVGEEKEWEVGGGVGGTQGGRAAMGLHKEGGKGMGKAGRLRGAEVMWKRRNGRWGGDTGRQSGHGASQSGEKGDKEGREAARGLRWMWKRRNGRWGEVWGGHREAERPWGFSKRGKKGIRKMGRL